jgi:hypothetical protein
MLKQEMASKLVSRLRNAYKLSKYYANSTMSAITCSYTNQTMT